MTKSGFVYVLRNSAMPGLVKVGYTIKPPQERAAELFSSGVPQPFSVVCAVFCNDPYDAEQRTHACLHAFRIADNREFFRVDESHAVFCLLSVIAARFDNINVVKDWMVINPRSVERFAIERNIEIMDAGALIAGALDSVSDRSQPSRVMEEVANALLSCT